MRTKITYEKLVDQAFENDFKLTRDEVRDCCLIVPIGDFQINWTEKEIFIKPLNAVFRWE